jgi:mannose-6-phosphate isomerase-like protein (cupin superfamily)
MGRVIGWEELGGRGPTNFLFRGGEHGAGVCVFVVDFAPVEGPRLHRHPYEEVFVVHEGRAAFTAGEEALEAVAGQVVVVPAGMPHRFVNAGGGRLRLTSVQPRPQTETEWLEG